MNPGGKKNAATTQPATSPSAIPLQNSGIWKLLGISVFLAVITLVVYGQTLGFGFVNYDDDTYVYENSTVKAGLTLKGIGWAFENNRVENWIPLTMISHMMDCQFYQLDASGHHLTNVLLHTASVIVLFLVLWQMTRALWRSAFVAAVFAIHPLHVESVAWVSERKDVLSGLFFMLTLWSYVRYTRNLRSLAAYLLVVFFFALGLMSKSMLVTLPVVLLLLDYWPLNRFAKPLRDGEMMGWSKHLSIPVRLIMEKIPLLVLAIACCCLTVHGLSRAIMPLDDYPLPLRIANALVACAMYIYQMFYPANLAVLYPYPFNIPLFESATAFVLLAAISLAVLYGCKARPWLLTGWLWYLVMLVPVIGIIQVGYQARADRYTYLPQIGLYVMITWIVAELGGRLRNHRVILGTSAALVLATLTACAYNQTGYWRDGETLWSRTLACTQNNSQAHNNLGTLLVQKGELDEAAAQFQKAIEIDPSYVEPYNNLGNIACSHGELDEAISYYQTAAKISPNDPKIQNNLGVAYAREGQWDDAITYFLISVGLISDYG
jgi:tetratricopeptide (TPR) repeat protein